MDYQKVIKASTKSVHERIYSQVWDVPSVFCVSSRVEK